jgi:hypothetical protein
VNRDRQVVTELFTSQEVRKVIYDLGFRLISFADLTK